MMSSVHKKALYHVGDTVRFNFSLRTVSGKIIEDHGALGVGGRHLYRVSIPMEPYDPMLVELREDEIDGLATPGKHPASIKKPAIIDYLQNGGLIAILQSNLSGGKNQPRAWLCFDLIGNVTHTFDAEQGLIGGQTVPFWALQGDKVFSAKRSEVSEFVQSFGLARSEAEAVISDVGTAP